MTETCYGRSACDDTACADEEIHMYVTPEIACAFYASLVVAALALKVILHAPRTGDLK